MMNPFKSKKGLGRGLSSLIGDVDSKPLKNKVSISSITRNKFQPRKNFDKDKMEELTNSIKERGIIQPIVVRKSLDVFLLSNMTEFGKSKILDYKTLENLGYNIVIYPVTTQRLAMKSVEDGLRAIFADGHQKRIIARMQSRKRLYELVEYEKYNSLDKRIYNFSTAGHEK